MFNPLAKLGQWGARQWVVLALLALIGLCVFVLVAPQLWALYHWRAGVSALEHYHSSVALGHFNSCLRVWPKSLRTHLLASRAARRDADYEQAREHLTACQRLIKGTNPEVAFEDALLRASMGDINEVESYLRQRVERNPEQAPLCLEALAEGYARMYRLIEAQACLTQWLEFQPDNVQAHYLRGKLYLQVNAWEKAAADMRKVIELDPQRDEARERLARILIELSRYDEALEHLEYLRQRRPDDLDSQVRMARCYHGRGQSNQARRILAEVLEVNPDHGPALFVMGKIVLMAGEPEKAENWFRHAVHVQPYDYQSQWHLYQALSRQEEKSSEAQEQLAKAEKLRDRRLRLSEISNRLAVRPHEPALHYEMGQLLMQLGNKELAAKWLSSALHESNDEYQPAHVALAEYYEEIGDKENADLHRQRAQATSTSSK
jgi:tetratricopeptide (TPR) repeat protein